MVANLMESRYFFKVLYEMKFFASYRVGTL